MTELINSIIFQKALTRARLGLVLLGNARVLSKNPVSSVVCDIRSLLFISSFVNLSNAIFFYSYGQRSCCILRNTKLLLKVRSITCSNPS